MKRTLNALAVVLILAAVAAVVIAVKQNPVTFTEVHPEIQPIEPQMVDIPAGPFARGNPKGTPMEQPVRTITLSAFRIGAYEVTNAEWKRFADATGRAYPPDPLFAEGKNYFETSPYHPVVEISWTDAAAYCAWLASKSCPHG